jgi:hypothetical protein
LTGTAPSLLLHPLDFLGSDDVQELRFFPGMNIESERKLEIVSRLLRVFSDNFTIANLQRHAQEAALAPRLAVVNSTASTA